MERETQKKQTNNAVSFLVTGHGSVKKRKESHPQEGLEAAAAGTQREGPQLLPQTLWVSPEKHLPFPLPAKGFWFTHTCTCRRTHA